MANTPIEFRYFSGLTLTADLTAADDTSRATELSATENTNGKGRYTVTYTGSETGHHVLTVKIGTDVVATFDYTLADTTDLHFPKNAADAATGSGSGTINLATETTIIEAA